MLHSSRLPSLSTLSSSAPGQQGAIRLHVWVGVRFIYKIDHKRRRDEVGFFSDDLRLFLFLLHSLPQDQFTKLLLIDSESIIESLFFYS